MNAIVWLIATLKGGVRKTTSAMMIAFALAKLGYEVLVIDADTGTQGVTDWAGIFYTDNPDGSLPFDVAQWSNADGLLIPFVRAQVKRTGAQVVIIDVGGEAPEVLKQAARIATRIVSPVGPDQAELGRVTPTRTTVREVSEAPMHALLTRVPVVGAGIAIAARGYLIDEGHEVLTTEIPHSRAKYENVWGSSAEDTGAYADVANELVKLEGM